MHFVELMSSICVCLPSTLLTCGVLVDTLILFCLLWLCSNWGSSRFELHVIASPRLALPMLANCGIRAEVYSYGLGKGWHNPRWSLCLRDSQLIHWSVKLKGNNFKLVCKTKMCIISHIHMYMMYMPRKSSVYRSIAFAI